MRRFSLANAIDLISEIICQFQQWEAITLLVADWESSLLGTCQSSCPIIFWISITKMKTYPLLRVSLRAAFSVRHGAANRPPPAVRPKCGPRPAVRIPPDISTVPLHIRSAKYLAIVKPLDCYIFHDWCSYIIGVIRFLSNSKHVGMPVFTVGSSLISTLYWVVWSLETWDLWQFHEMHGGMVEICCEMAHHDQ